MTLPCVNAGTVTNERKPTPIEAGLILTRDLDSLLSAPHRQDETDGVLEIHFRTLGIRMPTQTLSAAEK